MIYPLGTFLLLFITKFGSKVILAQFKYLSMLETIIFIANYSHVADEKAGLDKLLEHS